MYLYAVGDSDNDCREKRIFDVNTINKYFKMNKLKLNENKSKLLESDKNVELNDGFVSDKELKLKYHVDLFCRKIGKVKVSL